MREFRRSTKCGLLAGLLLAAVTGCSGRNGVQFDRMTQSMKETLHLAEKPQPPIHRIEPIWKAAKGSDTKGFPTRGAAGQILFFTAGSPIPTPLQGDGTIVIYIFDDQGTRGQRGTPIHKFTFSLAAWNAFLQEDGSLGPSYHIFIPYTRKTVYQATMSLSVQLRGVDGKILAMSNLADVILTGPIQETGDENVNLASPQESVKNTGLTTLNRKFFDKHDQNNGGAAFPPIQQISGNRRSGHPLAAGRSPQASAQALLDQNPDLQSLMKDYRQQTGHPVQSTEQGTGRDGFPAPNTPEQPAVNASRGFRLGEQPSSRNVIDDDRRNSGNRDARSLLEESPKSSGRRTPLLTTAGFRSQQTPRGNEPPQQREIEPGPFGGHPLRDSFDRPERQIPDDHYQRPAFTEPQNRPAASGFHAPTAGELLNGPMGKDSAFRDTSPPEYRPDVDERNAWSND